MQAPITVGGIEIRAGQRASFEVEVPTLYSHATLNIPVQVVHGRHGGPRLLLTAALHGDEINGVEIIRRVLRRKALNRLRGTLIAVPVVNVYGFIFQSRYLPDRRDLNRVFPGNEGGSMAARLAYTFLNEIASAATHCIDLHTGAIHRENLPQIRAYMDDEETAKMARAFPTPVILNSELVEGSLRMTLLNLGIPAIVYEASEALRFNEVAVRAGVSGILEVMRALNMLRARNRTARSVEPLEARSSFWIRAPQSGILRSLVGLGDRVKKADRLGIVSDPFGDREEEVTTLFSGIVIGRTNIPLVNQGEALFHIARFESTDAAAETVEAFQQEMSPATDTIVTSEPPIV
jgi:predicted deacylase